MTEAQGNTVIDSLAALRIQADALGTLLVSVKMISAAVAVLLCVLIFCVIAFRNH